MLDAERFEEAVTACRKAFEGSADPRAKGDAGYGALRAQLALGGPDDGLPWVQRLTGTPRHADALRLASSLHLQRGANGLARESLLAALELDRQAGRPAAEAWTLYSLAYVEWLETRYRPALGYALESAAAARRQGDPGGERQALELQQGVLAAVGDLAAARRTQLRIEELLPAEDAAARARWLAHQGDLWLDGGKLALARETSRQALAAASGEEEPAFFRSLHLNLVEIALARGELEAARREIDAAWGYREAAEERAVALLYYRARLAREEGRWEAAAADLGAALDAGAPPDWSWDLHQLLGRVEEARGRDDEAERAYRQAVEEVEALRRDLGLEDLKPWLLERKRNPFEALFRLLVRRGRPGEALAVAERARARTFLDALLRTLEANAEDHAMPAGPGEGPEQRPPDPALERLESLERLMPSMGPGVAGGPASPGELARDLEGTSVLSYFEADGELWLWSTEAPERWRRLGPSAEALASEIDGFLTDLDDAATAARLGRRLLPRDLLPAAGEPLTVVTDGALGRLPFAALRLDGGLLIERHPLAFAPSLEALALLRSAPRREAGPAVVVGDPLGDLPEAREEAAAVARLAAGGAGLAAGNPLLGEAATVEAVLAHRRPRLLHLATHSGLGPRGPWLALAGGPVAADTLVASGTAPRLAVLATCASAARPGREMWGSLGAAFLAAGGEAVLAALTSVEDAAARTLTLSFYRLGGLRQPARALARAQRELAAEGRPAAEWAPFLIMGHGIYGVPGDDSLD